MQLTVLTAQDVAKQCQISLDVVYKAMHRGDLKPLQLGEKKAFRFLQTEVNRWLRSRMVKFAPTNPFAE